MPRSAVIEEARKIDRTQWRNLYLLAEHFGVTISALRVRLEQLNLLYVDQKTNTLYPSHEEAHGQGQLF
jgi:Zn-dependent peptidase ImmA (M78 family)